MKGKKFLWSFLTVIMLLSMTVGAVLAEDGLLFRRNISKTPDNETEKAAIYMMDFYVPAQASTGEVLTEGIKYYLTDDATQLQGNEISDEIAPQETRFYAKPLVSVWIDDLTEDTKGGITFGKFDAFVGISLDDGTSWRTENLSRSSDLSSFTIINDQVPYAYPGDVHNVVHQVAEDKILAVWVSKYCQSGFPLYSITPDDLAPTDEDSELYLADLEDNWGKNAMYLYDLFGVAGDQGSVDYADQGYPEIGEIPYSCVWTARGKIIPGDDPMTDTVTDADGITTGLEATHVVWTAPERLTSGVRDANLPAVDCAKGAGCALTWQEDPEGLRPGKGLGPGEGWSGAVANAKTDIWYSYIPFSDFDYVVNDLDGDENPDPGEEMLIEDYEAALTLAGTDMDRPKPYVPMAMPVRITDNDMCKGANESDPYCWIDFDTIDTWNVDNYKTNLDALVQSTASDYCSTTYTWTNPQDVQITICITEDGRYMYGRVASTRVRMALKPYFPDGEATDLDLDSWPDDGSAWLSFAAEESKALGVTAVDTDDEDLEPDTEPVDIGKDMFYYSFDYAKPYNLSINDPLMDAEPLPFIVQQGGMLNQPAMCSPYFITTDTINPLITCPEDAEEDGEFYEPLLDEETGYEYYLTEIARRFALALNNIANITNTEINQSGLTGMLIYKQGIINQGGPADIMLRKLIKPVDFNAAVDNPFAFENMECVNPDGTSGWVYPTTTSTVENEDGSTSEVTSTNPNYLKGLCMAPAINISGTTIAVCTVGIDNNDCAAAFPVADDGSIPDDETVVPDGDATESQFPKVLEWRQCQLDESADARTDICVDLNDDNDLDDQTWENPYDIAKGHRGFLYGDMVMMMYAWSPNWKSNSVGNDHYNLYQRRSFDGGLTWTTTPEEWCEPDNEEIEYTEKCGSGVDVLEYYYLQTDDGLEPEPVVWTYAAGELEQARNISLLQGNKVTILDPRYSPAGGLKQYSKIYPDWMIANGVIGLGTEELPYVDDAAIDPSKYYMVYETGDNTTVAEGEAVPLNLYYSRATVYGDFYEWYDYINDEEDGFPTPDPEDPVVDPDADLTMTIDIEPRFPWLENDHDILSGEASVILNPGGTIAYNVWNQWEEEITHYVDEYGIEHEEELIFNSDIIYRRLYWLPDGDTVSLNLIPVATILTSSQIVYGIEEEEEQIISLYATARDLDAINDDTLEPIQEYIWTINGVPIPVEYQDAFKEAGLDCFSGKVCNAPSRVLSENWDGREWSDPSGSDSTMQHYTGWVEFALQVRDNDEPTKYSRIYKVNKYISQYNTDLPGFRIFLPLTTK